jgi:tetratricopeptide (TPR) repeat protein
VTGSGRYAITAVLASLLIGGACDRASSERSVTRIAEPDEVADEALMVALSRARNLHHKANVYLQAGDVAAAMAEVRAVLLVQFPPGHAEAEDVRQDARARLGKLLLGQGQLDEALHVVDEGIAAASRESFFVANLYTVRGEVLEARAAHLQDRPQRAAALHQAIAAFDRSNRINERIQKRLMQEMVP